MSYQKKSWLRMKSLSSTPALLASTATSFEEGAGGLGAWASRRFWKVEEEGGEDL